MLHANVHIDLPSEPELRQKTLIDWVKQLLGRELDLRGGTQIATVSGLSVFKSVTDALEQLRVTDVMSVIVDGKTAYVDTDQNSGDLGTAVSELDARDVLEDEFKSMTMALSRRADGLHTLIEVKLQRRVEGRTPELVLEFASRLDAMQIQRGESPAMYAARLREQATSGETLREALRRFTSGVAETEQALVDQLGALALEHARSEPTLRLIRPGPRQLDHFRRLTWGATVRMPKYRPLPLAHRLGAYDTPFYHYYFDPYFDFVAWVTLQEIVAGRGWSGLAFSVVDAEDTPAFDHTNAVGQAAVATDLSPRESETLVEIRDDHLVVDPAVPEFGGPDPGEIGDPRLTPGFAAGDRSRDAINGGWNEVPPGFDAGEVDGGDLGGSCGASCGGCGG